MEDKLFFHNSKGDKLVGVLSNPSGNKTYPIILMVHGHSSSKYTKKFVTLTALFSEKNISTFRIDLYGHGESEGAFEECTISEAVNDILQAIAFLKKKGYNKIGLLGSSFGGIASIIAASKTDDIFLLALKSPVSNYEEKYLGEQRFQFLAQWKKQGFRDYSSSKHKNLKLNYSFYENALQNDGYKGTLYIKIPTFIIHGGQDETVPVEQSIKLVKLIPNCKLKIVKGSDHVYTKPAHRDQMLQKISDFMFSHI